MTKRFEEELAELKKCTLKMGNLVEIAISKSIKALLDRDVKLAEEVIGADDDINHIEIVIDEKCLDLLALRQPVAIDLRFIAAIMKMNGELERIGDLAVNIAERAKYLATQPELKISLDFTRMMEFTQKMVRESLDALVNKDAKLARKVCLEDDVVDDLNRQMFLELIEHMKEDPETIERSTHLMLVSRHLERIADQATNIAEDVVYMVEGKIIKHHAEDYCTIPR
ncbi:MAG TPA: phosphate signaling complex protein PhoU [Candidatus Brocadiia bacterium]|nr:phosphate signaling complex protein PhoU [Planctomycetota bacterium]MDO8092834.1 phosphate signaling complex protein PhoU [Candidatus Brocadiales bacterium]